MKALPLSGVRRALVLAPHPDDEAIGAWGVIGTLRRRGVAVRVVVASDGASSHPNSVRWPRARLVTARRRETLAVLRQVGVSAGAVRFLGLPDGALPGHDCRAVIRAVARCRPDLLLLPCDDDAHPDHRAVAAAVARMSGARRFGYKVWGARVRGPVWGHPVDPGRKRAAVRRYRTQCGAIGDDPDGFAIAGHELRAFCRPAELFRRLR